MTRRTKILISALLAVLSLGAITAASALATEGEGWLVEGKPITTGEGALAAETEMSLELTDTKTLLGSSAVLCSAILAGTIGPEAGDEIVEVLNLAKEKISSTPLSGTALECTEVKICEEALVWPVNLPWLTEIEGMEAEPSMLDKFFGSGGKEPGFEIECMKTIAKPVDECVGATSAELAEGTSETNMLVLFNSEAPVSSEALTCSQSKEKTGDVKGEGNIRLTSGKSLAGLVCEREPIALYRTPMECVREENASTYRPGYEDVFR